MLCYCVADEHNVLMFMTTWPQNTEEYTRLQDLLEIVTQRRAQEQEAEI